MDSETSMLNELLILVVQVVEPAAAQRVQPVRQRAALQEHRRVQNTVR